IRIGEARIGGKMRAAGGGIEFDPLRNDWSGRVGTVQETIEADGQGGPGNRCGRGIGFGTRFIHRRFVLRLLSLPSRIALDARQTAGRGAVTLGRLLWQTSRCSYGGAPVVGIEAVASASLKPLAALCRRCVGIMRGQAGGRRPLLFELVPWYAMLPYQY